ncbi:hypothetical protein [Haloplanus natans]|uniref:hypothetical protein n=1 Tax=Haloplanus natans TaxID=376171 RepID=UPI0006781980|nr:hypothetical protein [Haloplanus natans]
MTSVPGTAFRAHLATLDRETAIAFTAAVYDARGWTVERDADDTADLLATPPGADRPRRLVVRVGGDGTTAPSDADRLVDAATLHELVAYALPTTERTRLCRDVFDRDPGSFGAAEECGGDGPDTTGRRAANTDGLDEDRNDDSGAAEGRDGASPRPVAPASDDGVGKSGPDGDRSEWLGRVAVVGLALSLALGGVVTATGSSGVDIGSPAALFGGNGTETATDESAAAFPRGIDETGVTNAAALANAHEATLSNRSYRLTVTYREFEDGELRGVAHERALVASPDRYRSRVRRLGSLGHEETVVASGSMYANGSVGYIRTGNGVRRRMAVRSTLGSSAEAVSFVDRTERTIQWYLSANETRIVGRTERNETTTYRVAFEGDPWPESRNVTGWARVDETGLVRELHRSYTPAIEPGVRIEVTIRIVPGPVTVTRPAWMAATNTTADGRAPARVTS